MIADILSYEPKEKHKIWLQVTNVDDDDNESIIRLERKLD